jgi:hypothetical protein
MSNTTNLFDKDLVSYLVKRYGRLLQDYPPKERVFGVKRSEIEPAEDLSDPVVPDPVQV